MWPRSVNHRSVIFQFAGKPSSAAVTLPPAKKYILAYFCFTHIIVFYTIFLLPCRFLAHSETTEILALINLIKMLTIVHVPNPGTA
jgi:hypothetical protein